MKASINRYQKGRQRKWKYISVVLMRVMALAHKPGPRISYALNETCLEVSKTA